VVMASTGTSAAACRSPSAIARDRAASRTTMASGTRNASVTIAVHATASSARERLIAAGQSRGADSITPTPRTVCR
jgi:hypothetical protein